MPESVTSYYGKDHDRLDELFKTFQRNKRKDFDKAKEAFREFKTGLQRHIVWEERVLFPLFEKKVGGGVGPTEVMRKEHRTIGALLEAIHQRVKRRDPDSDTEEAHLLEALGTHNRKEETILYPAIDGSLQGNELMQVYVEMDQIPPSAYQTCCGHDQDHIDS